MQASPSIRTFLKFAVLYCIFICAFCNAVNAAISTSGKTTFKNHILSPVNAAPDFYCHSINSISSVGNSLLPGFKNIYPGEFGTLKQQDNRLTFSLYIFYSGHLLTRLRKNDIIYPFHYFW